MTARISNNDVLAAIQALTVGITALVEAQATAKVVAEPVAPKAPARTRKAATTKAATPAKATKAPAKKAAAKKAAPKAAPASIEAKATDLVPVSIGLIKAARSDANHPLHALVKGKANWQIQGRSKPEGAVVTGRVVPEAQLKALGFRRPSGEAKAKRAERIAASKA